MSFSQQYQNCRLSQLPQHQYLHNYLTGLMNSYNLDLQFIQQQLGFLIAKNKQLNQKCNDYQAKYQRLATQYQILSQDMKILKQKNLQYSIILGQIRKELTDVRQPVNEVRQNQVGEAQLLKNYNNGKNNRQNIKAKRSNSCIQIRRPGVIRNFNKFMVEHNGVFLEEHQKCKKIDLLKNIDTIMQGQQKKSFFEGSQNIQVGIINQNCKISRKRSYIKSQIKQKHRLKIRDKNQKYVQNRYKNQVGYQNFLKQRLISNPEENFQNKQQTLTQNIGQLIY